MRRNCAIERTRGKMQPLAKKARLSLAKPNKQVSLLPDGIYDRDITIPAGITNISMQAVSCNGSSTTVCSESSSVMQLPTIQVSAPPFLQIEVARYYTMINAHIAQNNFRNFL